MDENSDRMHKGAIIYNREIQMKIRKKYKLKLKIWKKKKKNQEIKVRKRVKKETCMPYMIYGI